MTSRRAFPVALGAFLPLLVAVLATGLPVAAGDLSAPVENWKVAPYWMRPAPEAEGRHALAAGPTALPFIALPPCRLVDTRGNAPLTGGFLPPATVRSYTLTGVCGLPANAQAVSLNATVVHPTGPGFLTLYPQGGAFPPVSTLNYLGNDVIVNAAVVPLSVSGGISMALGVSGGDVVLDTNGYYAAVPSVTSLNALTGDLALQGAGAVTVTPGAGGVTISAPTGVTSITGTNGISASPAAGAVTVTSNATPYPVDNTIVSRDGSFGFAAGYITLNGFGVFLANNGVRVYMGPSTFLHAFGDENVFLGIASGSSVLGGQNVGVGDSALTNLLSGSGNVAVGYHALVLNGSGGLNTALGYLSGSLLTSGSNNVHIGNPGLATESNTIRIGSGAGGITTAHTKVFFAAVRGVTTGFANAVPVLIDGAGQLGTTSSSIRFKDDVRDMGDESAKLMRLRPVTFRYKAHGPDGPKQFGLVAEEVNEVLPELVARDKDGEIETVMYHELPAMLLNEIQRLEKRIADLERRLSERPAPSAR